MSHDLEINGFGEANAMFAQVAWHQLGNVVGESFDFDRAVTEGLPIALPVQKVPMGDLIIGYEAPADEFAAVRGDGRVLATGLGEQWTPFQTVDGYAFGSCIVDQAEGGRLLSLGAIDNGRKWFMTFDLGEFSIGDYKVADYLSVNGSFNSSWKLQAITSPIIEVCANTIAAARFAGKQHYSFKHTSGIHNRVEEAKRALVRHREVQAAFQAKGEELLATKVSGKRYSDLLQALFPVLDDTPTRTRNVHEDAKEAVTALYKGAGGFVDGIGNAWSVVQAVNTWENWGQPVRNTKGRTESETRALRQIEQVVDNAQPFTTKALDLVGALN